MTDSIDGLVTIPVLGGPDKLAPGLYIKGGCVYESVFGGPDRVSDNLFINEGAVLEFVLGGPHRVVGYVKFSDEKQKPYTPLED